MVKLKQGVSGHNRDLGPVIVVQQGLDCCQPPVANWQVFQLALIHELTDAVDADAAEPYWPAPGVRKRGTLSWFFCLGMVFLPVHGNDIWSIIVRTR